MRPYLSPIQLAIIFEEIGEVEIAKLLDEVIKRHCWNWGDMQSRDVISLLVRIYGESSFLKTSDRLLLQDFYEKGIFTKEYFLADKLAFDFNEVVSLASDKLRVIQAFSCEEYASNLSKKLALMSEGLYNNLYDVACGSSIGKDNERLLFLSELYYLRRTPFSKMYDKNFNCKGFTDSFDISFMGRGKATILNDDMKWTTKGRQQSRFLRGIKKIPFRYKYSDKFWEELNNGMFPKYHEKGVFKILEGKDIVKYYNQEHHSCSEVLGTLESSCMRYDSTQEYIEFYAINKGVVSMLTLFDENEKVMGRALLWKYDENTTIMDRIYGSDQTISRFKKYARDNNFYWKQYQSYDNPTKFVKFVDGSDEKFEDTWVFAMKNIFKAPYMDTFKYTGDGGGDTIYISNDPEYGSHCLDNTDGNQEFFDEYDSDDYVDTSDYVTCVISGRQFPEDQCTHVESGSINGWVKTIFLVTDVNGDLILRCDAIYLEYMDCWIREESNEHIRVTNTMSPHYDTYIYLNDSTSLSGIVFHKDDSNAPVETPAEEVSTLEGVINTNEDLPL